MTRENRILLSIALLTLLAGCANINSRQEVLAAGSQVEVRSYQTRTYDTNNKILVMRAVMATLQDLRFVIDKADDTVGVVSATKLDGYALSISVSVRASGEQMLVRANAQYNLRAIEEPGPYQDFFAALDKGLFLDNNLIETRIAQSPQPASNAIKAEAAQAGTRATSVYAFYGEAEAEINAGSQNSDLWARALVEVEGNEQKRKARYIELRAEELYRKSPKQLTRQNSPAVIPRTSATTAESISAQAAQPDSGLTGVYIDNEGKQVNIQQSANRITGTYGNLGGTIDGMLKGDVIEYKWENRLKRNGMWVSGTGRLQVSEDRRVLSGNWLDPSSSTRQGTWTLTKVGNAQESSTKARLPAAMSAAATEIKLSPRNLSGTYISEITTNSHWIFHKPSHRRILVVVDHRGDDITAVADSVDMKITGTVDGDRISFFTWPSDVSSSEIKGKWKIVDDGTRLEGKWTHPHGGGKWNLARIQ